MAIRHAGWFMGQQGVTESNIWDFGMMVGACSCGIALSRT
jgi:hypothetical protein